jgi:hypothetical protein
MDRSIFCAFKSYLKSHIIVLVHFNLQDLHKRAEEVEVFELIYFFTF